MQDLEKKIAELEALLFIHGEELPLKKIATVLELSHGDVVGLVAELKARLEAQDRGLSLVSDEEKIQLTTKPQFGKILEKFIKSELSADLTPASLEALSIVAYFAPISRAKIDYLRGVNSMFILRSLLIRGLVERYPDPHRQNAFLYKPSFDFLKHVGVENKESLPDYEKFHGLLQKFEASEKAQSAATAAELVPSENTAEEKTAAAN